MLTIPPEDLARLTAIGITDPATSPWHRMDDSADAQICAAETICCCTGQHRRVDLVPLEVRGRWVFIGQCSDCRRISWSRNTAPSLDYTGRATVGPSRPMYAAGRGA